MDAVEQRARRQLAIYRDHPEARRRAIALDLLDAQDTGPDHPQCQTNHDPTPEEIAALMAEFRQRRLEQGEYLIPESRREAGIREIGHTDQRRGRTVS